MAINTIAAVGRLEFSLTVGATVFKKIEIIKIDCIGGFHAAGGREAEVITVKKKYTLILYIYVQ